METVKIISGIMLVMAYISLAVAGFLNGLQEALIVFGLLTVIASLILFCIACDKD